MEALLRNGREVEVNSTIKHFTTNNNHKLLITGRTATGKTTLAKILDMQLTARQFQVVYIDLIKNDDHSFRDQDEDAPIVFILDDVNSPQSTVYNKIKSLGTGLIVVTQSIGKFNELDFDEVISL